MNTISNRLTQIENAIQDECWYITKQTLKFESLCIAASIVETYNTTDRSSNFETFFSNMAIELYANSNHRLTNNCYYVGLLSKKGKQYSQSETTETFEEIKKRCDSEFDKVEKYQDIIDRQIEKVFLSHPVDKENESIRKDIRLNPLFLTLKVILILGELTGNYLISLSEFKNFLGTTKIYSDYTTTVILIWISRLPKDQMVEVHNRINNIDFSKFSNNRLNKLFENLSYLNVTKEGISFKPDKIEIIRQKILEYELSEQDLLSTDFLESKKHIKSSKDKQEVPLENGDPFNHKPFTKLCNSTEVNLKNLDQLIPRFIASLATKPFVLLSGLSGSGKTKLAQAFAMWICETKEQYKIIPVGADWINREPLLGYTNALNEKQYVLPENGALKLIIEASKKENQNKPYFLILDEMNLSHVERYFADFLSVMESNDSFKLHNSVLLEAQDGTEVAASYKWPENLFVVGTVNIDETTYMFSPKVLDRASVIEFRVDPENMDKFLKSPKPIDMDGLVENGVGKGAGMAADFIKKSTDKPTTDNVLLKDALTSLFKQLSVIGAEFGYRTAIETNQLFAQLDELDTEFTDQQMVDIIIMQKLLPKIHGSRKKLVDVLEEIAVSCVDDKNFRESENKKILDHSIDFIKDSAHVHFNLSLEKLKRMYDNCIKNGFASYAEA